MPKVEINFYPKQWQFHVSNAVLRGFVGGRGSGKTWAGAADMFIRAMREPGLYGIYAPTFSDLTRYSIRTFRAVAGEQLVKHVFSPVPTLHLSSGAEILCGSLDNPEAGRGPSFRGVWIDEGSLVSHESFINVLGSLRSDGRQGWLTCTFTPKGKLHWTYDTFGKQSGNTSLVFAASSDNPYLPADFVETVASQMPLSCRAQELGGEFVDIGGTLFHREWFRIVDAVPAAPSDDALRMWDFAATEKQLASDDPDFTAGVKMTTKDGLYYIVDVVHERRNPGAVEDLVRQTAITDGRTVRIGMEQEPGSSGKLFVAAMIRKLSGYAVRAEPSTGDKVSRALPLAAQSEAGNVCMLRAEWNQYALDELASFPGGRHDDIVDAAAKAYSDLAQRQSAGGASGVDVSKWTV